MLVKCRTSPLTGCPQAAEEARNRQRDDADDDAEPLQHKVFTLFQPSGHAASIRELDATGGPAIRLWVASSDVQ